LRTVKKTGCAKVHLTTVERKIITRELREVYRHGSCVGDKLAEKSKLITPRKIKKKRAERRKRSGRE